MIPGHSYFAEELEEIREYKIPSSFGQIYSKCAGNPSQPFILIVHGSGPKNSGKQYLYMLHEYLVRVSYQEKFFVVTIDCPGYGRSEGSKEAVKTFPLKLFREILAHFNHKRYFGMLGHSQGGAAIFNAAYEDPTLTEYLLMDRPVCGAIQRFRKFPTPCLLIYDIEDDGHPIWQGRLLYKELANSKLYTYRSSYQPYYVPDRIWDLILEFISRRTNHSPSKAAKSQDAEQRRNRLSVQSSQAHRSVPKVKLKSLKILSPQQQPPAKSSIKLLPKVEETEQIFVQKSSLSSYSQERNWMALPDRDEQPLEEPPQIKIQKIKSNSPSKKSNNSPQREGKSPKSLMKNSPQEKSPENDAQVAKQKAQKQISPKTCLNPTSAVHSPTQQVAPVQREPTANTAVTAVPTSPQREDCDRCSICMENYYYKPQQTSCHHLFCTKCIGQALLVDPRCPLCRTVITNRRPRPDLEAQTLQLIPSANLARREAQLVRFNHMMRTTMRIEIGNTSQVLMTKPSSSGVSKKKYVWRLFVNPPLSFPLQEVLFNINMGNVDSKPIKIRQRPYQFEARGTFSFGCQIILIPQNKQYADLTIVYRINVEPGSHSKQVYLRMKKYQEA